jgi:hypothetical protein
VWAPAIMEQRPVDSHLTARTCLSAVSACRRAIQGTNQDWTMDTSGSGLLKVGAGDYSPPCKAPPCCLKVDCGEMVPLSLGVLQKTAEVACFDLEVDGGYFTKTVSGRRFN